MMFKIYPRIKYFKILMVIVLSFSFSGTYAQFQMPAAPAPITGQLPSITPPSPTVAAFMKFEEVPVDNYTGIPNITIPICNIQSLSKDVGLDVKLQYHPGSIAIDEVASYTGLGWSLFTGGTISRTVKDSPDEIFTGGIPNKIGILQDNINDEAGGNKINRYYQVLSLQGRINSEETTNKIIGPYGWEVAQNGSMDTQHDIFQYNFMGHSGRFYIKRNTATGALEPIKLDNDNAIKIVLQYTQSYDSSHAYNINFQGFTLYDDLGYQYLFDIQELTTENNTMNGKNFGFTISMGNGYQATYASAFHLRQIKDNNDKTLMNFTYEAAKEVTQKKSFSHNYPIYPLNIYNKIKTNPGLLSGLLPQETASTQSLDITTQKIKTIEVVNKARITFNNSFGRADSNINSNGPKLSSILIHNWYGELIKEYRLDYDYLGISTTGASGGLSRLALSGVAEIDVITRKELYHGLGYKNGFAISDKTIKKDYWGYFTNRVGTMEPDEEFCSTHVLNSMSLPAGGSIQFDFEPNTYSYIGSSPVTDFGIDDDPEVVFEPQIPSDPGVPHIEPMNPTMPIDVYFVPNSPVVGGTFTIHSTDDPTPISIDGYAAGGANNGAGISFPYTMLPNKTYYITYNPPAGSPVTNVPASVKVVKRFDGGFTPKSNKGPKWLLGGGVRIKKIKYFDGVSAEPVKTKNYDYKMFSDSLSSSGSLAFAKPLYKYTQSRDVFDQIRSDDPFGGGTGTGGTTEATPRYAVGYNTTTDMNNLSYIRTKGSDIGYKNVTVWETGNGKSEYTYTSPIDYPETDYNTVLTPPFRSTSNRDFLRGILLKEKHYAQYPVNAQFGYKPVAETEYVYPLGLAEEHIAYVGTIMDACLNPRVGVYKNFVDFKNALKNALVQKWGAQGEEGHFLSFSTDVHVSYGWVKLDQKISREYFYPQNNQQGTILTKTETYKYNDVNKRISEITTSVSTGNSIVSKYFYDNNTSRNRIGVINKIETYKGADLLEVKEIRFANSWQNNIAYLPRLIVAAKGNNPLENQVQFLQYDQYSNVIEAKQENGITICYIWGYNYTEPIAVIENISYNTLIANSQFKYYIDLAVTASNSNNTSQVINNLRLLQGVLPATSRLKGFAYKPLVGVLQGLDEGGRSTYYTYDGYNRLKEVRDRAGHLISENKYNYRNQQ